VTKKFSFQALALIASMGLCAALTSGCNPEEPAKPLDKAPAVAPAKPGPAKTDAKTPPAATTPAKEPDKTK
jgi:hypothetical protein